MSVLCVYICVSSNMKGPKIRGTSPTYHLLPLQNIPPKPIKIGALGLGRKTGDALQLFLCFVFIFMWCENGFGWLVGGVKMGMVG